MNIALFGATGGTGREVLAQALAQGHAVRALARDPQRLPDAAGLTVVAGDVLDPGPVADCIAGTEAVVSALGTRMGSAPVEAQGTRNMLTAMQAQGVRRLIVVTSMGVGDSAGQLSMLARVFMKLVLGKIMAAKEEQETLIRASGLDWTIVRPGGLTDGRRTGRYVEGLDKTIRAGQIARADVAEFVLRQLGDDRYLHQTPAVT